MSEFIIGFALGALGGTAVIFGLSLAWAAGRDSRDQ